MPEQGTHYPINLQSQLHGIGGGGLSLASLKFLVMPIKSRKFSTEACCFIPHDPSPLPVQLHKREENIPQ